MSNTVELYECEYCGCNNLTNNYLELHMDNIYYVCTTCEDKVKDSTGYCGPHCMLGYGCDQSC